MIASIHQPDYLPWLGLYYKMAHSDVFVYLDDAQYSNEAAHDYNVIKGQNGKQRLKVPVEQHLGDLICNVRTRDELKWKNKHLNSLQMNYGKAPFFKEIFPGFADVIKKEHGTISNLNMAINEFICDGFGIHPKIVKSSDLNINTVREERVIDICLAVGADTYLSGNGARAYQTEEHFTAKGLTLKYLDYKPITYPQINGEFLPCMSAIDYIFNCGFDWDFVDKSVRELNNGNR